MGAIMRSLRPRALRPVVLSVVVVAMVLVGPRFTRALEVGEPAPGFTLPSTTGSDISLGDYRGKKFVLLEFYGADFAPT
jgi:AhpC/TSA family protein